MMLKDRSSKGPASIQYSDFTPPAERVLIFLISMAEACTASLEDLALLRYGAQLPIRD